MSDAMPLMRVSTEATLLLLESDAKTMAEAIYGWRDAGLTVRVLRGRKMRTVQRLFDEVAAALQFPHYFGENWPALNECLEDMDWMPLSQGVALVLLEASQVLVDEPAELEVLVRSIVNANMTYAQPIDEGEWWDRPAVPFHVVLHGAVGEAAFIAHRWGESGASVTPFPS